MPPAREQRLVRSVFAGEPFLISASRSFDPIWVIIRVHVCTDFFFFRRSRTSAVFIAFNMDDGRLTLRYRYRYPSISQPHPPVSAVHPLDVQPVADYQFVEPRTSIALE